jgi:D-cysteine desulfhydrase
VSGATTSSPLLERYPGIDLPWRSLGRFPTPVEPAPWLGPRVWIKRDDLTGGGAGGSGANYGGNKVRKLEFVLADALSRGRRTVLTMGATGSNHVLATALYARALGFAATHAVLFPQPPSPEVERRLAVLTDLGVRISRVAGKALVPMGVAARTSAALAGGGGMPYLIGPGASSPLGTLGYVNAALELAAQIAAGQLPAPRVVYVPLGSGGTVAGLLLGFRLAGLPARVRAVRTVPAPWVTIRGTVRLAARTAALLADAIPDEKVAAELRRLRFSAADLDDVRDQIGRGYGAPTPAGVAACAAAATAGVTLETTYTGKACAALMAAQPVDAGHDVLFWNTYSPYAPPKS